MATHDDSVMGVFIERECKLIKKEWKRLRKIGKKCQYVVTRAKSEEVDFYWSGNYTEVCRTYNKWWANLMFIWFALIKSPDGYNYTIIRLPGIQS